MLQSILRLKTIADTMTDNEKVSAISILYRDINNPAINMEKVKTFIALEQFRKGGKLHRHL
jgi:hypothetical protein